MRNEHWLEVHYQCSPLNKENDMVEKSNYGRLEGSLNLEKHQTDSHQYSIFKLRNMENLQKQLGFIIFI